MEFFIRQGASDPILKLRLIDDGKNDKTSFNDLLETADITFDMYDVNGHEPYILNAQCTITTRIKKYENLSDEYYLVYRFTETQTERPGKYEGVFNIQFLDTNLEPTYKLIVPISEKLYINII